MTGKTVSSFNPARLVIFVLLLMLSVSFMATWYGNNVNLPRYCGKTDETIIILRKIMTEDTPAGEQSRRPYIIAAKILFLLPKYSQEDTEGYLLRVKDYIQEDCTNRVKA